jgi:hypothetical protein
MNIEPCPNCICATCENAGESWLCCVWEENPPCVTQNCPDYARKGEDESNGGIES